MWENLVLKDGEWSLGMGSNAEDDDDCVCVCVCVVRKLSTTFVNI